MRATKILQAFALVLALSTGLSGEDKAPAPLKYDRLELTDGRKLKRVVIKSYDAKSGKLVLLANGKAMSVSADLLPEALRAGVKEAAPPAGETVTSTPERSAPVPVVAPPPTAPAPVTPPQPAVSPAELARKHKDAALQRAQNYYRFEYPVGSDAARITAQSFQLEEPVPVPGWTGRYRTQGNVFLEWFDSRGWSFKRGTSRFEVLTEGTTDEPKVVDFSVK